MLPTFTHTRAVEPLVPYVDNIHEVIKKPFVAKGPQQFAMKACNSSNLCYSVVVCARRQELQPPPVPSLAARDTITQLLPHGPPGQHTATIPDHTTHVQMDTETTTGLTPGLHNTTQNGQNVLHKSIYNTLSGQSQARGSKISITY